MEAGNDEVWFAGFLKEEAQGRRRGGISGEQEPGKIERPFRGRLPGVPESFLDQLFAISPPAGCKLQQRTLECAVFQFQERQGVACDFFQQGLGRVLEGGELLAGLDQEPPPDPESSLVENDPV